MEERVSIWKSMTEEQKQKYYAYRNAWRKQPCIRKKAYAYNKEYMKTWIPSEASKEKRRKYRNAWVKANDLWRREVINRFKMKPCMDCGIQYNPWVMDFDHRKGERKVDCVGTMFRNHRSMEEMKKEIKKCDVVCANCHRERSHKTKWGKSKTSLK